MILSEMDFTLEGDYLLVYLSGDFYFLPAHNSSYRVSRDAIFNASVKIGKNAGQSGSGLYERVRTPNALH
jgi:hypothetical protein